MQRLCSAAIAGLVLAGYAAGAPVPGDPRPVERLTALLGKSHLDPAVVALHRELKSPPVARYFARFEPRFFHVWAEHGLDFEFDGDSRLVTVFLYADGADGRKAYTGRLPAGLTFAATRADVEKALGPPAEVGGGQGVSHVWLHYPAAGVKFDLATKDAADSKAPIRCIALSRPEK